jgi:mannosyltransferase
VLFGNRDDDRARNAIAGDRAPMPSMSLFPPPDKAYARLPTISSSASLSSLVLNPSAKTPSLLQLLVRKRIRVGKLHVPLLFLFLCPPLLLLLYFAFLRHGPNESSVLSSLPPMRGIATTIDEPFVYGCQDPRKAADAHPRVNGAFVMLARNSELQGVLYSIDSIERHFNRWFNYPYVFLNDEHFNSTFKAAVINATSSPVQFGKVDKSMFGFPDWVDQSWAKEGIASQGDRAIMYGGLESYHHMCRFYSGYRYIIH